MATSSGAVPPGASVVPVASRCYGCCVVVSAFGFAHVVSTTYVRGYGIAIHTNVPYANKKACGSWCLGAMDRPLISSLLCLDVGSIYFSHQQEKKLRSSMQNL